MEDDFIWNRFGSGANELTISWFYISDTKQKMEGCENIELEEDTKICDKVVKKKKLRDSL